MGTHFIPVGRMCHDAANAITAIEQAEKQEPVAYLWRGELFFPYEYQAIAEEGDDAQPLYTAPPKREWVGLTDEEIKEIIGNWGDTPIKGYTRKLFDQIEAKLKEKNK